MHQFHKSTLLVSKKTKENKAVSDSETLQIIVAISRRHFRFVRIHSKAKIKKYPGACGACTRNPPGGTSTLLGSHSIRRLSRGAVVSWDVLRKPEPDPGSPCDGQKYILTAPCPNSYRVRVCVSATAMHLCKCVCTTRVCICVCVHASMSLHILHAPMPVWGVCVQGSYGSWKSLKVYEFDERKRLWCVALESC